MATLTQTGGAVEVLYVFNRDTGHHRVGKELGDQEYWTGLLMNGPGGKPWPSEDLNAIGTKGVMSFYRATVKEPGTGHTLDVCFHDAAEGRWLDGI